QTREFFSDVARVLRPGGLLALNCPDEPGLRHVADVVAALRGSLATQARTSGTERLLRCEELCDEPRSRGTGVGLALIAMRDVVKGRRYGNTVLGASDRPLDVEEIRRQVLRWPFPSGVLAGATLERRLAGGRPLTDAASSPSPAAPDPGRWRAR